MKIRILKDTALHGKGVSAGEILDVSEADFNNLAQYKLAEKVVEIAAAPAPEYTTRMQKPKK